MGYWQAKADLDFMKRFCDLVRQLWEIEGVAATHASGWSSVPREVQEAIQAEANNDARYQDVRAQVAKGLNAAIAVAHRHGVAIDGQSLPPPALGGAVIPFNLLALILHDNTHGGISHQRIADALNQTLGACEEAVPRERRCMLNPLHWAMVALVGIIRLPSVVVAIATGGNEKAQEQVLLKLLNIAWVVFVVVYLGLNKKELAHLATAVAEKLLK